MNDSRFSSELGRALKGIRARTGMTQQKVARRLGVKRPTVAKLESGWRSSPKLSTVMRYLRVCGATLSELKEFVDNLPESSLRVNNRNRLASTDPGCSLSSTGN